ncbi:MAG TPA: DUF4012 domain-containing protein [Propionicimonas sp.]
MSHPQHRPTRWIIPAAIIVAFLAVGIWGALRVVRFEQLTSAGRVSALWGLQTLVEHDPVAADSSLRIARRQFADARSSLGPEWLEQVPWLGRQLAAARDLCTLAMEGSSAGIEVARLMGRTSSAPQEGRLSTLLQLAPVHLDPALASLARVTDLADNLDPAGLMPQLAEAVSAVKGPLAQVPLLRRSHDLLDLERYLFSRQHRFLVVTQDSSELQPTGGSMETYGLVTFGPQGFALTTSADVASLPKDTLNLSSPPGKPVRGRQLSFADANWWMDFPTSASKMAEFWKNLGQPEIDGIVAVDVPMIQELLDVYGPLVIPEAKAPLTASNLMTQLTDVVKPTGRTTIEQQRKKAVISLTTELVNRVTDLSSDQLLPTIDLFMKAADQKHAQIYLLDPTAQASMVAVGWAGALDPPDGTTDLVGVSNSDVEPSKANLGVTKSLDYKVDLKADGGAGTTLTLGFQRSGRKLPGIPAKQWANYLRAHRFAGTQLASASRGSFTALDDPTGVPTFGHFFQLRRGSRSVVLKTTLPQALRAVPAGNGEGPLWEYRLLVAKQADLVDTRAAVSFTVPAGWRVVSANAAFRVTGEKVPTSTGTMTVTLRTPLSEDLLVNVTVAPVS